MPSRRSVLASATAVAALTFFNPGSSLADEPVKVVATFSVLGDMVQRIGGEHIALTTLVGPDGDTHVYQPTPQAARAVAEADVLFVNGLEFEGWLERLSEAASFDGSLVVATAGIDAIAYEDHHDDHSNHDKEEHHDHDDHAHHDEHEAHGDHKEEHDDHDGHDGHEHAEHGDEHADHDDHHDHDDHAGHDHGAFDPHAWHDPDNALIYINNIAAGLAQADPDNAGVYYANRTTYVAEIEALKTDVSTMLKAVPSDRRTVVTSHDAFGYFARAFGLTFEAPQGLSTESEISAADVAKLITQIRDQGISAVFVESVTDDRIMQQIANETGVSIGGTLYSDALSGSDGPASTYLDMLRHNATTLSKALRP